jgi:hypothetical protein
MHERQGLRSCRGHESRNDASFPSTVRGRTHPDPQSLLKTRFYSTTGVDAISKAGALKYGLCLHTTPQNAHR